MIQTQNSTVATGHVVIITTDQPNNRMRDRWAGGDGRCGTAGAGAAYIVLMAPVCG